VVLVDGASFAVQAAGQAGPLLVAQCWSRSVLSDIKLSVDTPPAAPVVLLHHLGLPDEELRTVPWDEMDRSLAPDHLTALWIPVLAAPVAGELVRLAELVRVLRQQCPWDREQTHGSLSGHLLEETYEVLEAIDAVAAADSARPGVLAMDDGAARQAVADLEEELGDLLFQVVFHAALAAEEGRFTLADVARGIHDKLVSRHPHVFGDADVSTPEEMATTWEATKKAEKNRTSVTEGIPAALPALALAAKLQRKALAVGMDLSPEADDVDQAVRALRALPAADPGVVNPPEDVDGAARVGEALFAVVGVARRRGIDPEAALRVCSTRFRASVEERG
jgi:tetrapyrrole methylase family protein/MazG family protein